MYYDIRSPPTAGRVLMALIAALLPNRADRDALGSATEAHEVAWATSWRELHRLVRTQPVGTVVVDLHAEARKDGVLRVFRFGAKFPLTPVVVWGEMDGRELFRLGKAGAADVVASRDGEDRILVGEVLAAALERGLPERVDARLAGRVSEEARAVIRYAATRVHGGLQVPELALAQGVSVSTLERRCERWGIPTPGRLLLWLRVLHGLRWLVEPGRSVESVAAQLGYSSGAAFRRALRATVGPGGGPLSPEQGLARALDGFLEDCRGDPALQRLSESEIG
jgi:AraC-like DNA-binding protein